MIGFAGNNERVSIHGWVWLAAAHCDDNFKLIAVSDGGFSVTTLGYDLAVALHCYPFAGIAQTLQQATHSLGMLELAGFAVDGDRDHCVQILSRSQDRPD